MNTFKRKTGFSQVYCITPAIYEKQTKKRSPYVQKKREKIRIMLFVQNVIILFKLSDYTKKREKQGKNHMENITKERFLR